MNEWKNFTASLFEDMDVAGEPCDGLDDVPCGSTGSTGLYVDMHIFQLCPECAWRLTEQYHADGCVAPWEIRDIEVP